MENRPWQQEPILDIRPAEVFRQAHLHGAASVPLSPGWTVESLERDIPSIFLPPRHESLNVVATNLAEAEMVAAHLRGRGERQVTAREFSPENWPREQLATGSRSRPLWNPPPYLRFAEPFLPPPALGPVLDLACGSGRALVWLAERGYRGTGVDWQPEALEMGQRLAASRGVDCRFQPGDLRDRGRLAARALGRDPQFSLSAAGFAGRDPRLAPARWGGRAADLQGSAWIRGVSPRAASAGGGGTAAGLLRGHLRGAGPRGKFR